METKPRKPYNLKRKWPSTEELIEEYREVKDMNQLAIKYGVTKERIRQKLVKNKVVYQNLKKEIGVKVGRKPISNYMLDYPAFLALVKKLGLIPGPIEIKKHLEITNHTFYLFKKKAESEGFVYLPHFASRNNIETQKIQMIEHLKELREKFNHTPSFREINKAGKWFGTEYSILFGSLTNAQKLAGLIPNKAGAQKGNKNGLFWQIKKKQKDAAKAAKE